MEMRFTLSMENLVVNGAEIDSLVVDWTEDVTQAQVMAVSNEWISTPDFLARHIAGLQRVGESSLTIEPVAA